MAILLLTISFLIHPLHVSITEIAFDEKEKELEIIMRVFIDDLETAIRKANNEPNLNILEPKSGTTDDFVREYVMRHLGISLDGKQQVLRYLGHEIEGDAMLCYIQGINVRKWRTIEVKNDVIMEVYDDQSNLVNVTVRGEVKSLRLLRESPSGKISFNVK